MSQIPLQRSRGFRFELVGSSNTPIPNYYFNLIVPPESYSIEEMPRHSITKLFGSDGNINIEDFGDDNKIIRLTGHTGGHDDISGFDDNPIITYDGKGAMEEFRRRIINWRTNIKESALNPNTHAIRMYNFFDNETYFVYITKFTVNRSASKPLYYNYNLECITLPDDIFRQRGIRVLERFNRKFASAFNELNRQLSDFNNNVFNTVNEILQPGNMVANAINDTLNLTMDLVNTYNNVSNVAPNIVASTSNQIQSVVDSIADTSEVVRESIIGRDGNLSYSLFGRALYAFKVLRNSTMEIGSSIKHWWNSESNNIMNFNVSESITSLVDDVFGTDDTPSVPTFESLLETQNRSNLNNAQNVVVQSPDGTFSSLSKSIRRNNGVDYQPQALRVYNNIKGDITPETPIFIPSNNDQTYENYDNNVITNEKDTDYFGKDIQLDNTGGIISYNNSLGVIEGVDNLFQSIDLSLQTQIGSLLSSPEYGFDRESTIGEPSVSVVLNTIMLNYRGTVLSNPRINTVENVTTTVDGDVIRISSVISTNYGNYNHNYEVSL